jgi:flagellar capping protein FliD
MVSSVDNNQLSSYFTNIISNVMTQEQAPLTRLTTQRDTINIQRAVYTDLQTKLNDLRDSARTLLSTGAFNEMKLGRDTSVTKDSNGNTILSASASTNAPSGVYDIVVDHLAQAQRRASVDLGSGDKALNEIDATKYKDAWSFYVGGAGTNAASITSVGGSLDTVDKASSISTSTHEIDSGDYTVETQMVNDQLQYRIKDADGNDVGVGSGLTTGWQNVGSDKTIDTGRGLILKFNDYGAAGKATVHYQAMGRKIDVDPTDSLVDISEKINNSLQPGSYSVGASVIGGQLVLSNTQTGTKHLMQYSSELNAMLGFESDLSASGKNLQDPLDAVLTVNGLSKQFTSSSNTNISNVIYGVTLNLSNKGNTTLTVSGTTNTAKNALNDFVSSFNTLMTYVEAKTAITKNADDTYTRGPLANDTAFGDLRMNLMQMFLKQTNTGLYHSLSELGLSINDSLRAEVTDSSKFENALKNNSTDFATLMDSFANNVLNEIDRFTGTKGYLNSGITGFDSQLTTINDNIKDENLRLTDKKAYLTVQYAEMQSTLMLLSYQQSMMSSILSATSSSA